MTVSSCHEKAMDLYEEALLCKDDYSQHDKLAQALVYETSAADACHGEPSRSILYRSAATIALQLKWCDTAILLAQKGLDGNPPDYVAKELQDVLDQCML